jgi:hypothetical protein
MHRGDPVAVLDLDPVLEKLLRAIQDPDYIRRPGARLAARQPASRAPHHASGPPARGAGAMPPRNAARCREGAMLEASSAEVVSRRRR